MEKVNVIVNKALPSVELGSMPQQGIMDSAAPAAIMDNLMDSQKAGCPQVPHNRLDKS
jgi:hypothetical protein